MSMTLLKDGRVLIINGKRAALWDPANQTTAEISGPVVARYGQTATLLNDGRVLVVGGTDTAQPRPHEAEIFDPAAFP